MHKGARRPSGRARRREAGLPAPPLPNAQKFMVRSTLRGETGKGRRKQQGHSDGERDFS